jgi:hypothetical protein
MDSFACYSMMLKYKTEIYQHFVAKKLSDQIKFNCVIFFVNAEELPTRCEQKYIHHHLQKLLNKVSNNNRTLSAKNN